LQQTGNTVERPLDALNFFLADVRDGLGPYLAIYLLTEQCGMTPPLTRIASRK
jgi:hypothetical protein